MKKLNVIIFITCTLLLSSCNFFSNDDEELEKRVKKYKKERLSSVNKDFEFLLNTTSYNCNIGKDTVKLILKEYYKEYAGYSFNLKSNKLDLHHLNKHKLHKNDFINNIVSKYNVNEKTVYIVFSQIELLSSIEHIKRDIALIQYNIEEIEAKSTN